MSVTATSSESYSSTSAAFTQILPIAASQRHFPKKFGGTNTFTANILYLAGHGLIEARLSNEIDRRLPSVMDSFTKITSKGIDFIRDDGGLSAILNVQTIKFHRDAVVVLEDLFTISNMNDKQKEKAKSTLDEMTKEALKKVVKP